MNCDNCGKSVSGWSVRFGKADSIFCKRCFETPEATEIESLKLKEVEETQEDEKKYPEDVYKIVLTTESYLPDAKVKERLGIVAAECVLGMNIFRDIFADFRDFFGGQSLASQKVLSDLKSKALMDLKEKAHHLGANAVIAIDLDYNEFSGGGKSMLFLVASGTAVILEDINKPIS